MEFLFRHHCCCLLRQIGERGLVIDAEFHDQKMMEKQESTLN